MSKFAACDILNVIKYCPQDEVRDVIEDWAIDAHSTNIKELINMVKGANISPSKVPHIQQVTRRLEELYDDADSAERFKSAQDESWNDMMLYPFDDYEYYREDD